VAGFVRAVGKDEIRAVPRSAASEMTDAELHAAALARPARVLLSVNRAAEPRRDDRRSTARLLSGIPPWPGAPQPV
jgi:hypothetical protein